MNGKGLRTARKLPAPEPQTEGSSPLSARPARLPPPRHPTGPVTLQTLCLLSLGRAPPPKHAENPPPVRNAADSTPPRLSKVTERLLSESGTPRLPLPVDCAGAGLSSLAISRVRRGALSQLFSWRCEGRRAPGVTPPVRLTPTWHLCGRRRRRLLMPLEWEPVTRRDGSSGNMQRREGKAASGRLPPRSVEDARRERPGRVERTGDPSSAAP